MLIVPNDVLQHFALHLDGPVLGLEPNAVHSQLLDFSFIVFLHDGVLSLQLFVFLAHGQQFFLQLSDFLTISIFLGLLGHIDEDPQEPFSLHPTNTKLNNI